MLDADWLTHPPWEYCCQGGWRKPHRHTPTAFFVGNLSDLKGRDSEVRNWKVIELTKSVLGSWTAHLFGNPPLYVHCSKRKKLKVVLFVLCAIPSIICFLDNPLSVSALMKHKPYICRYFHYWYVWSAWLFICLIYYRSYYETYVTYLPPQ